MTSTVTISTTIVGDQYQISAVVNPGSVLPPNIFVYTNTGTNILGTYYGICGLADLTRLQVFTGTPIPIFGNMFVTYGQGLIYVPIYSNITGIITTMTANIQSLSTAYTGVGVNTQVITIT